MKATGGLRVLALASYPESAPSTRVRVAQFRAPLAERGIEVRLHPFLSEEEHRSLRDGRSGVGVSASAVGRLRRVLRRLAGVDVVWVQRGVAPFVDGWVQHVIQREGVPLVYDFDDAVYLPQEGGRGWVEALRRPRRATTVWCRRAAVVLAGNPHLAEWARTRAGAHRVEVVPSTVDRRRFASAEAPPPSAPPTLGWIGSDTTVPYLESLAAPLRLLAEEERFRLLVVAGARRPELPGVDVEVVRWSAETEARLVRQMDVGLYPLEDTPWSRGKCGYKALQYLAAEVPCVASPVGVLKEIVEPGVTGLHAVTDEEWATACTALLRDPTLRSEMGRRGAALVDEHYSIESVVPALEAALRAGARTAS